MYNTLRLRLHLKILVTECVINMGLHNYVLYSKMSRTFHIAEFRTYRQNKVVADSV